VDRIISELEMPNEIEIQKSLRPKSFDEYIGQENLKEKMNISIKAAQKRNMTVDHILLYGPPGLGKTTLAGVIANEMQANLIIDEIHRLNNTVEEILYPAMEDGELDIIIGKGPSAKSIRIELPPFTLIGATTRAGLLSAPLRDRFGVSHKMEYYNIDEIRAIIIRGAKILGVKISEEGAIEISKRSRGTPRIANRLLKRVRDYCEIKGNGTIDVVSAKNALDMLGVDSSGLDELDRNIINSIIENYDGGPVGIETLSLLLGEDRRTLEEVYEPYLVKIGFLKRTNRGRVVTPKAYQHFKKDEVKDEDKHEG